jgi:signal transduction histidine kinase
MVKEKGELRRRDGPTAESLAGAGAWHDHCGLGRGKDHAPTGDRMGSNPTPDPMVRPQDPVEGLVRLLADAETSGTLEEALARIAVARCGAARAWLLARRPGQELLALAGEASESAEALAGPPIAVRPFRVDPARLDPACAAAWDGLAPEVGHAPIAAAPWAGHGEVGAVALRPAGEAWGMLVVAWPEAADRGARTAALAGLARLAEAALTARAGARRARRAEQQSEALAELSRAASRSAHLTEVIHLAVRLAAQATGSRGGALWLTTPEGEPRLEVTHGPAGDRERVARGLRALAAGVISSARPERVERPLAEPRLGPEVAATLGTVTVLPLIAFGRVLGALAVFDPDSEPPDEADARGPADVSFLGAVAAQVSVAVDQARRFDEGRRQEQAGRELRGRLAREERLALLGEHAREAAAAARQPLASITAFARRVHRECDAEDPRRELLDIVLREAARLDALLAGAAVEAPPEPASLRLENVNLALQETLQAAGEVLVRRRVRLTKTLAPDLPALLLDPERTRRVLANLLAYALDGVPVGGRMRVESRRVRDFVEVVIAHDGACPAGGSMDHVFAPFEAGTGETALALAQRVIREHGGEFRVRAEGDWGHVVAFTLPLAGNQDRRRAARDRRSRRDDRRRRRAG